MICKYYIFTCPLASTRSVSHVPLSSLESAAVIGPRNPPKLESPIPHIDCEGVVGRVGKGNRIINQKCFPIDNHFDLVTTIGVKSTTI